MVLFIFYPLKSALLPLRYFRPHLCTTLYDSVPITFFFMHWPHHQKVQNPANATANWDQVPRNLNWPHFLVGRMTFPFSLSVRATFHHAVLYPGDGDNQLDEGQVLTAIWRKWLKNGKRVFKKNTYIGPIIGVENTDGINFFKSIIDGTCGIEM